MSGISFVLFRVSSWFQPRCGKTGTTNSHEIARKGNARFTAAAFILIVGFVLASCRDAAKPSAARLADDRPANAELSRLNALLAADRPVTKMDVDSLNGLRQKYPESAVVRQLLQGALIKRGDWAAAEKSLAETDDGTRTNTERINLAKIYLKQGKFAEATDLLTKMSPDGESDVEVAALLGQAQFYTGNLDEAAAVLEPVRDALIQQKRADDLAVLGTIYSRRGDHDNAIAILIKTIETVPDNVPAHNALARAYAASGDEARAGEIREKLRVVNELVAQTEKKKLRLVSFFYQLEDAYAAKDHDKVIALAQQILPESDDATRPTLYQYLAAAYQAQGKEAEARNARVQAAKLTLK